MKSGVRLRFAALSIILGVLILGILGFSLYTTRQTVRKADLLREDWTSMATHIRGEIAHMNNMLIRSAFSQKTSSDQQQAFEAKSLEFKTWIDAQMERIKRSPKYIVIKGTQPIKSRQEFLAEVASAYDTYRVNASEFWKIIKKQQDPVAILVTFQKVDEHAKHLEKLVNQVDQIFGQVASDQPVVINLGKSLDPKDYDIRVLVLGIIVIGLAITLAYAVYRVVVTPLHVKIDESDTIIERQGKLAHFGELAAGLAHEIRNPLTAINARVYTLAKTISDGTPESEDIAVIRNEISRLDYTIKEFLQLARPAEPERIMTSVTSMLESVRNLLSRQLEKDEIKLIFEPTEEFQVLADPDQIKQVLINLVLNAAQSIGHDGAIKLRGRRDSARLNCKEQDVFAIEVEDTGPGIAPEIQPKLFDPFFSTKKSGSGLGLSIAARIIEKHDGTLDFRTTMNEGTTFRILFPIHEFEISNEGKK